MNTTWLTIDLLSWRENKKYSENNKREQTEMGISGYRLTLSTFKSNYVFMLLQNNTKFEGQKSLGQLKFAYIIEEIII